jgi:hypothetical protein
MNSSFSLREKARMRGSNNVFYLIFILLTPALSSRRGSFFLNVMAVTLRGATFENPRKSAQSALSVFH